MNDSWWVQSSDLDPDQQAAMALPIGIDHLVVGPPGSGKTNLLLLKGSQMVMAGKPNVLILTFTRTLREFVASGVHHYAFSSDKIKTFQGWMMEFLREESVAPETDTDFEKQRSKLAFQINALVDDRGYSHLYDAILVDEGQDCLPEEIALFRRLGKVLFVAADERQRIYQAGNALDHWKSIIPRMIPLRYHYRNGERICMLADAISKASDRESKLLTNSQYIEKTNPSSVDLHRFSTLREQVIHAATILEDQLKAYPDELLGIVCPRREELDAIIEELKGMSLAEKCVFQTRDGAVSFDVERPVCICTAHSAKGLEFRAMHLMGTEFLKRFPQQRRLAYTAVTRAKTSLTIYHCDDLSPFLASAISSIENKAPAPVNLPDLFKKTAPHVE